MKLLKLVFIIPWIIASFSVSAIEPGDLEKGSIYRDSDSFTVEQRNQVWNLEDIAAQNNIESIKSIVSYILPADSQPYFVLERKLLLASINLDTESITGPWPLTRWPHQFSFPEIARKYQTLGEDYPLPMDYEGVAPGPGCIGNHPLRYGDIENDGSNELVLFLDEYMIVFSPEYERIVFAEYLDASDWFDDDKMNQYYEGRRDKMAFQFASKLHAMNNSYERGQRAYSKIYLGDFDQDDNPDILVWRKLYQSNLTENPTHGFTKIRDVYQHFERDLAAQADSDEGVTGEYLPQDSEPETIQAWLADNQLTWVDGFLSKSECEGREGELIPDMHDPRLNDPEVLPPSTEE